MSGRCATISVGLIDEMVRSEMTKIEIQESPHLRLCPPGDRQSLYMFALRRASRFTTHLKIRFILRKINPVFIDNLLLLNLLKFYKQITSLSSSYLGHAKIHETKIRESFPNGVICCVRFHFVDQICNSPYLCFRQSYSVYNQLREQSSVADVFSTSFSDCVIRNEIGHSSFQDKHILKLMPGVPSSRGCQACRKLKKGVSE